MTHVSSLNIYYQNVRGLRTKSHNFLNNVLLNNYDLIILTETWLTPDFRDAEYFCNNYDVYRRDRVGAGATTTAGARDDVRGGGVLIAVRSGMRVRKRTSWCSSNDAEELWLTLEAYTAMDHVHESSSSSPPYAMHIACGYFPHGNNHLNSLNLFFDNVSLRMVQYPEDTFLLIGDFNVSYALWSITSRSYLSLRANNDPKATLLSDFMCLSNLKQYNSCFNASGRILDLVLSNKDCHVSVCPSPLTSEDVHHKAIVVTFTLPHILYLIPKETFKYIFHAADFESLGKSLASIDWKVLHSMNTESAVEHFYLILFKLIEAFVPKRKINVEKKYPVWYSRALIRLIRNKLKIHSRWKKYNNPRDYQQFKLMRTREKKLQVECYNSYIKFSEEKITVSPKYFWTFIKSKYYRNNIPSYITFENRSSMDGEVICNLFNEYFNSVFVPVNSHSRSVIDCDHCYAEGSVDVSQVNFTCNTVRKYFKTTNINKGAGVDGVHPLLISRLSRELSAPMTIIYRKSLKEGCYPQIWKKAIITPIPKGGDKHDVRQYRPISKLCILGKIFEKIIIDELSRITSRHISQYQHGFFKGRSVDTNLVLYTDFLLNSLDKGYQVDAVYTDFSKAFDKICHYTLIKKLSKFGIHGDLLRWLRSYISNRSQAVALRGYVSRFLEISSGIPQGSHLGPFLFTIYINDIDSCFHDSHNMLYADDTKIYRIISTYGDCLKLQSDLRRFELYCENNQLFVNPDKCYIISFTRKNNPINYDYNLSGSQIKRAYKIRDLGLIIDAKLNFNQHLDKSVSKAYKQLGMILRLGKPFKQAFTYKTLYYCFVRSVLEFACVVWCPQYAVHVSRIEKVQYRFLKALDYRTGHEFTGYSAASARHRIISLENRRTLLDQMFLYKIVNSKIDSSCLLELLDFNVPRVSSRSKNTFFCSRSATNYARNTFVRRSCRFYNDRLSDIDIFDLSIQTYKRLVQNSIVQTQ
jgi:hypothetical protein